MNLIYRKLEIGASLPKPTKDNTDRDHEGNSLAPNGSQSVYKRLTLALIAGHHSIA